LSRKAIKQNASYVHVGPWNRNWLSDFDDFGGKRLFRAEATVSLAWVWSAGDSSKTKTICLRLSSVEDVDEVEEVKDVSVELMDSR
jgi:hypothetical protein